MSPFKSTSLLSIVLLMLAGNALHAQRFDWVRFTPAISSSTAPGERVVTDGNGHIYTAQRFFDQIIVEGDTLNSPAFNATNFLLIKWNQDGEVVGYKTFHSYVNQGEIPELVYDDVNDHLILTVATQASVIIDDVEYPGVFPALRFTSELEFVSNMPQFIAYYNPAFCKSGSYYSTKGYATSIVKTDAANNVIWTLAPTNGAFAICDMAPANDTTFYALGYFMSEQTSTYDGVSMFPEVGGTGSDIGIMRVDTNGNVLNAQRLCRAYSYGSPIKLMVDEEGFIYLASTYINAQTIGGIDIPQSTGANDAFVAKLDDTFTALWITNLQHNGGNMESQGLCFGPGGEVVVSGLYGGLGTFGSFTLPATTYGMCYLALLDSETGTITYAERYGTDNGTSRPHDIAADDVSIYSTGLVFSNAVNTAEFGCWNDCSTYFFLTRFTNVPFVEPTIELTFDGFTLDASTNLEDAVFTWTYNSDEIDNVSGSQYSPTETGLYTASVTSYGCTPVASYDVTSITILGCIDTMACNYSPEANTDDGTCILPGDPCDDGNAATLNDVYTADCECSGTVGINETNAVSVRIYPNPMQTDLNLIVGNLQGQNNFQLLDVNGRIVLDEKITKGHSTLSLVSITAGVYVGQMTNIRGEVIWREKVVKR